MRPPLYDLKPLEAAIRSSHGRYICSSDNEVLFFHDKEETTEYVHLYTMCLQECSRLNSVIVRREVGPRSVKIGQIVRSTLYSLPVGFSGSWVMSFPSLYFRPPSSSTWPIRSARCQLRTSSILSVIGMPSVTLKVICLCALSPACV